MVADPTVFRLRKVFSKLTWIMETFMRSHESAFLCSNPRTVVEIWLIVKTFAIPVSAVDEHDLSIARKNSLHITGLDKGHSSSESGSK